ncbi:MAG: LysM peptidoglycan-binding domain-containing M23 family metallopeptidase [Treponema sp.]|jgi:murein DD-endopeptidase MepM/ murein hydrolase activator NlpD|nr:LysM peptidoglycan-binding domain-containing M23 family metallopeptidase [Treponema sp.]
MSIRYRFFCSLLFTALLPVYTQNADHLIQGGETIYSIARFYGVTVQDILNLNNITDPEKIQAGRRLRIPRKTDVPNQEPYSAKVRVSASAGEKNTEDGNFIQHQVAKGEAFYGIARRYGVSVQVLRNANNLKDDYLLKAGDWLRIPRNDPSVGSLPSTSAVKDEAVTKADNAAAVSAAGNGTAPRSDKTITVDAAVKWPIGAKEIRYMTGKLNGVALLGERSESVKNLTQGTVVSAGPYRGFGKVVIVQMQGGYLYVYGGCESLSVKEGDRVIPGTELGKLGIDGVSSRPQLFFLVYMNNNPVDPVKAPRA